MANENAVLEMLQAISAKVDHLQVKVDSLEAKVDSLPDLRFMQELAQRQQRDIMSFRDDMRVQTAIIMRLDTSHGLLLEEVRSVHAQISRMNDRVRKLEDESVTPPL